MACRTEQSLWPSTSKHIGIFVVEFSDFVWWILNQAGQQKLDYGQILYNTAKTRLDTFTQKIKCFTNALQMNPKSTVELITILNTIALVSDVNNDMQQALIGIKNRFATVYEYGVQVDEEEARAVIMLEELWKEVLE